MSRVLVALLLLLTWVSPALAAPIVVWMESSVPDEKAVKKAEIRTTEALHLAHVDLAFPPAPANEADERALQQLRDVVDAGLAQWDEFDVELGIAVNLEAAIEAIDLVRSHRDLEDIVDARLFQGAAVSQAFPPGRFLEFEEAAPYRIALPGLEASRPWVEAMALDPERQFTQADLANGAGYSDLQALQETVRGIPNGALDIKHMPDGAQLVIDGEIVQTDADTIDLRPGTHYIHVLRHGTIGGRQRVPIQAGEITKLPMSVSHLELESARERVAAGTTTGFPESVKASLQAILEHYPDAPMFVAVVSEGRVVVLPYARGATLTSQRLVTLQFVGEAGCGALVSTMFDRVDGGTGSPVTAPAVIGGLGLELGISYGVILGGFDAALTPAHVIWRSDADHAENVSSSVLYQPYGGIGFYVLRPIPRKPTLVLAGTYGFDYPAHMALGGRLAFGLPIDEQGTWVRLIVGGNTSAEPMDEWQAEWAGNSMKTFYVRFGLGALVF